MVSVILTNPMAILDFLATAAPEGNDMARRLDRIGHINTFCWHPRTRRWIGHDVTPDILTDINLKCFNESGMLRCRRWHTDIFSEVSFQHWWSMLFGSRYRKLAFDDDLPHSYLSNENPFTARCLCNTEHDAKELASHCRTGLTIRRFPRSRWFFFSYGGTRFGSTVLRTVSDRYMIQHL